MLQGPALVAGSEGQARGAKPPGATEPAVGVNPSARGQSRGARHLERQDQTREDSSLVTAPWLRPKKRLLTLPGMWIPGERA